jgi:hypothetical protein
MKRLLLVTLVLLVICLPLLGQAGNQSTRIITKTDKFDFGAGGTISITGAPNGAIKITGSSLNEIEITAEIELGAPTERDLDLLEKLSGFITDEGSVRTAILSIGSHNKFGQKKLPKNFDKALLNASITVNYVVRVPRYSDLEIDGGIGNLTVSGVQGTIRANYLESDAKVELIGGEASINIGKGSADVTFGVRGWRGRSANIQIAHGDLTVRLPTSLSAEIDAAILRSGRIENLFPDLKPRDRKALFTEKSVKARAGVGGSSLKFVVGDGDIRIEPLGIPI